MADHDPWLHPDSVAWIALSARLQRFVAGRSGRADVVVRIAPHEPAGETWPSGYRHDIAEVLLDARRVLDPRQDDPDVIDPRSAHDRAAHAALVGVACLAAAQATHTTWDPPGDLTAAERDLVRSIEQVRAAARHVRSHAADRRWVKAAVPCLFGSATRVDGANLIGLAAGGLLAAGEVEPVRERLRAAIGTEAVDRIEETLRSTVGLADGDREAVLAAARSVARELGVARSPQPQAQADLARAMSAAVEAAASSAVVTAVHSTLPGRDAVRAREAELNLRAIARSACASTFAKVPAAGRATLREPDDELRQQARDLVDVLRRARFRAPAVSLVPSRTPPGRLRLGEVMRRDAQREAHAELTASPWRQARRRSVGQPRLRVGLSWDVSRSRSVLHGEIADAAWLLSTALARVEGEFAAVAWNSAAFPVVARGTVPREVVEPRCEGGSSGCPQSLRALDGALDLSHPEGARVVVVATDARIGHRRFVEAEIGALAASGVGVLWLTDGPDPRTPPGAVNVTRPARGTLGAGLGRAICNILSATGA